MFKCLIYVEKEVFWPLFSVRSLLCLTWNEHENLKDEWRSQKSQAHTICVSGMPLADTADDAFGNPNLTNIDQTSFVFYPYPHGVTPHSSQSSAIADKKNGSAAFVTRFLHGFSTSNNGTKTSQKYAPRWSRVSVRCYFATSANALVTLNNFQITFGNTVAGMFFCFLLFYCSLVCVQSWQFAIFILQSVEKVKNIAVRKTTGKTNSAKCRH